MLNHVEKKMGLKWIRVDQSGSDLIRLLVSLKWFEISILSVLFMKFSVCQKDFTLLSPFLFPWFLDITIMAFDHNFSISVFYLSVLHFLSCIVMVSADCSWSEETMGWCKTHKIFLGQYSTSQIVSSSYYRKEFHKISSTPRVKDKVLRLRWISSSFSSIDALVFRIG